MAQRRSHARWSRGIRTVADDLAVEVRASAIHGQGVFATRVLARDSWIGCYEGARTEENGTYVLWVEFEDGETVGIDGDNALRYLNHAHRPNAEFRGDQLFALREIAAGEEITFDYGEDWALTPA